MVWREIRQRVFAYLSAPDLMKHRAQFNTAHDKLPRRDHRYASD